MPPHEKMDMIQQAALGQHGFIVFAQAKAIDTHRVALVFKSRKQQARSLDEYHLPFSFMKYSNSMASESSAKMTFPSRTIHLPLFETSSR